MEPSKYQLEAYFIAILLGRKSHNTLTNKASKEGWPHVIVPRPGRHQKLYPLETLPDVVQSAWASWNEAKRSIAMKEAQKEGLDYKLPPALDLEDALEVLQWKERKTYYQSGTKNYDKKSRGIALEAKAILMDRFGHLIKERKAQEEVEKEQIRIPNQFKPLSIEGETLAYLDPNYLTTRLGRDSANELFLHRHQGLAMAPLIEPGQLVILEQAEDFDSEGGLWLVQFDKDQFLRRVLKDPIQKRLILKGENPDYPPMELGPAEQKKLKAVGRVLGRWDITKLD